MKTFKQELLDWAQSLPDDCTLEDVEYFVHVRREVEAGLTDVTAGRVVPHEEVKQKVAEWLKSCGQPAR
jgi:predicted transcriptional regulator